DVGLGATAPGEVDAASETQGALERTHQGDVVAAVHGDPGSGVRVVRGEVLGPDACTGRRELHEECVHAVGGDGCAGRAEIQCVEERAGHHHVAAPVHGNRARSVGDAVAVEVLRPSVRPIGTVLGDEDVVVPDAAGDDPAPQIGAPG